MSEVVGYAPTEGWLLLGKHQDARGRWVEPLYTGDRMMICAATELDKAVLGAGVEQVMVVWRNDGPDERYRVATNLSFYGLSGEEAHREDELLREATSRFGPCEDDDLFDPRTLMVKRPDQNGDRDGADAAADRLPDG